MNKFLIINLFLFISVPSLYAASRYVKPRDNSINLEGQLQSLRSILMKTLYECKYILNEHIQDSKDLSNVVEATSKADIGRLMALSINRMHLLSETVDMYGFDFPECFNNYYRFGEIASQTAAGIIPCLENYLVEVSKVGSEIDSHLDIVNVLKEEANNCGAIEDCLLDVSAKITSAALHEPYEIYKTSMRVSNQLKVLQTKISECSSMGIANMTLEHEAVMKSVDSCIDNFLK